MDSLIQALYHLPAPERKRTKPMEVLALGMPRSGTESLSRALTMLGYDHTWHGFDPFDTPSDLEVLHDLAKLKWRGPMKGTSNVTAKDFDRLFGHSVAVTDLQPAAFARELILTYPDAKVILNYRQDEDAWYRSITAAFDSSLGSSLVRFATLFCAEAFWSYRAMLDYIVREVFHGSVHSNAKWVREEHHALIRGQCKDRQLLEWCVEDGWEPLCKVGHVIRHTSRLK